MGCDKDKLKNQKKAMLN